MTGFEQLKQAVEEYHVTYRNAKLERFKIHDLDDTTTWPTGHGGEDPGCYAILSNDNLLYIGKSNKKVNFRIKAFLKSMRWGEQVPTHVQVIEVGKPFEAASLEEYLIERFQPKLNSVGVRVDIG